VTDPRTQVVAEGYDAIAERYLAWRDEIEGDPSDQYLDELAQRLRDGARVLDLGCGPGVPHTRRLARRFRVVGVDVSQEQIARARANVPEAEFLHDDLAIASFPPASFEAVTAFYALNHVPRELLPHVFTRIHSWLAPGGLFLASLSIENTQAWTGEWLGTTMFFSGHDAATNRRLLTAAGFALELDELPTMREPGDDGFENVTFQWVLARR
jgi:cyclopropane fatty-acyl-phospholipid synthase-like methyltransferase